MVSFTVLCTAQRGWLCRCFGHRSRPPMWAEQGDLARRHGLSYSHFVRFQLDQLRIGQELTELQYRSHVYYLPPSGSNASLPASSAAKVAHFGG